MAKLNLTGVPAVNRRLIYKIMVIYREQGYIESWKKSGGPERILKLSAYELKHHLDRLESGEANLLHNNKRKKATVPPSNRRLSDKLVAEVRATKSVIGFCSTHPKTPAVAAERMNFEKEAQARRFCQECWNHHKQTVLGLKSSFTFKGTTSISRSHYKEVKPKVMKLVRQLTFFALLFLFGCATDDAWTRTNYNQWVFENRMASQYGTVEAFAMMGNPQRALDYDTWMSQPPIQTTPYFYDSFYYKNSPTLIYNFGTRRYR